MLRRSSIDQICREASLSPRQRQVLLMVVDEGLSYADVARDLGITLAAVKTAISKARRRIHTEITRREREQELREDLLELRSQMTKGPPT